MPKPRDYDAMARKALAAKLDAKPPADEDDDALPGDPPPAKSTLRPLTPDEQEALDWYMRKIHPDWYDKGETK